MVSKHKGINHKLQGNFLRQGTFRALGQAPGDHLLLSYRAREGEARDAMRCLLQGVPTGPFFFTFHSVCDSRNQEGLSWVILDQGFPCGCSCVRVGTGTRGLAMHLSSAYVSHIVSGPLCVDSALNLAFLTGWRLQSNEIVFTVGEDSVPSISAHQAEAESHLIV